SHGIDPGGLPLELRMLSLEAWAVFSKLKADPDVAAIPVIMRTVVDDRNPGYALGADDYLTKPIDRGRLLAVLQKYRREGASCPALVVEDDPVSRQLLRAVLEKDGFTVSEAENGRMALERLA